MVGKAICILSIIAVAVSFLLLSPPTQADGPNKMELGYASIFDDTTPLANPNSVTLMIVNSPNPQFDRVITVTGSPAATVHMGKDTTLGAQVGHIISKTTLSLLNGPCDQLATVPIPFINSSTDIHDTIAWDPDGDFARDKIGGGVGGDEPNGLSDYVDKYPEWLLDPFDPDGDGPLESLIPRARYTGHVTVTNASPPTVLTFLIFNPEQLSLLPKPAGDFSDTLGYINMVVLDNPGAEVAVSAISDFCVPLFTSTNLSGETTGVMNVTDDPTKTDEEILPFEWTVGGHCDGDHQGVDDDGDGVADDGCITIPDPCPGGPGCGEARSTSPAAGTGIYADGSQTSSHLYGSFYLSQRDLDWDGIGNQLDPCPLHVDNDADTVADNMFQKSAPYDDKPWDPWLKTFDANYVGDADKDRLPTACDPDDGVKLSDQDGDGYKNGQDNCPLVPNDQTDADLDPGQAAPDIGPLSDGIGDACEPDWDGAFGRLGAGHVTEWECKSYNGVDNVDCTSDSGDWVLDPNRVDGDFLKDMVRVAECIGSNVGDDKDSDGDGWCDDTEDGLGSYDGDDESPTTPETPEDVRTFNTINCPGYPYNNCQQSTCEDGVDNDGDGHTDGEDGGCSVPEHISIDVEVGGGGGTDPVGRTCDDGVDNDQDGKTDSEELDGPDSDAIPDCDPISGDTDDDGVLNAMPDNCEYCKNPTQVDRDSDNKGDACDTDDDGDGWFDPAEWKKGTDPKGSADYPAGSTSDDTDNDGFTDNVELFLGTDPNDDCPDDSGDAAWPLDMNNDKIAKINDVLFYAGKLKQNACEAGYDRRLDLNADAIVKINDVLFFAGKLKQTCT